MSLKKLGVVSLSFLLLWLTLSARVNAANTVVSIPLGSGTNTTSPGYDPKAITVVIGVNNTVMWINNDNASHTVTMDTVPHLFDSGNMNAGQTFTFTFTTAGEYAYHCTYHNWMHGTVLVKAASTVPEFPPGSLALVLLVSVAAIALVSLRLRKREPAPPVTRR